MTQPVLERISQYAVVRQMGYGGGRLGTSDRGPGVRADKLRQGSEGYFHSLFIFTISEIKRLKAYKKLLESAMGDASETELSDQLSKIYSEFEQEISKGGFLDPFQVRFALLESFKGDALWETMVDSFILMKTPILASEEDGMKRRNKMPGSSP
jgi:hypothetical protein